MNSENKAVLYLNLIGKWFDMIENGEKKEEYRECKLFYHRIFSGGHVKIKGKYYHPTDVIICFSNGYHKNRRQMFFELKNVYARCGNVKWGAEAGKQYYCLLLGNKTHFPFTEGVTF